MKKHNDDEWNLSISREEWKEIMAEEAIEETLAYYANIEATLAEEAEYEEAQRREAEISRKYARLYNDIDYEPEDPDDVSPDDGYAV